MIDIAVPADAGVEEKEQVPLPTLDVYPSFLLLFFHCSICRHCYQIALLLSCQELWCPVICIQSHDLSGYSCPTGSSHSEPL